MSETASCFLHGDFDAALRRCPECGAGRGSDTTGAAARNSRPTYRSAHHERDYLERTIATVRNHQDADNCWPQWANIFADEIERLWGVCDTIADLRTLADGFLTAYTDASVSDEEGLLQAVDPDEMRQLWHRVDEAAFDLREFLSGAANSQEGPR